MRAADLRDEGKSADEIEEEILEIEIAEIDADDENDAASSEAESPTDSTDENGSNVPNDVTISVASTDVPPTQPQADATLNDGAALDDIPSSETDKDGGNGVA
jgi:hypothetical protein